MKCKVMHFSVSFLAGSITTRKQSFTSGALGGPMVSLELTVHKYYIPDNHCDKIIIPHWALSFPLPNGDREDSMVSNFAELLIDQPFLWK
jgi:hypothetical protein